MRILIVEDEAVSRKLLQHTLEKWGHQVVAATNGVEAWKLFQTDTVDMVISDWMIPQMDGLELIRHIRRSDKQKYVYIFLLSAKSNKEDLIHGLEAGADDFLIKPVDQAELRARLRAGQRIVDLEQDLAMRNESLEEANQLITRINEKMQQDLVAAARIQDSLLPKVMPQVEGVQFSWDFRPCDQLAGDILNIFRLDEQHVAVYVLDVSNHGVPAALLAVTLSRILSPQMTQSLMLKRPAAESKGYRLATPSEVAQQLNAQFPMTPETGQYFTLLYGILNISTHEFQYVSAGHPCPIVLSQPGQKAVVLESEGMPIGFMDDFPYREYSMTLKPGERIYFYSDGIPEALNDQDEQFGEEGLKKALEEGAHLPLKQSLTELAGRVIDWCGISGPRDDVSLLAIEIAKTSTA
jgi:sigma-B regulation protein RsbU (phosphoserine phosphatase)